DTTVKAVVFEDSAALAGLVLAAAGIVLAHATGDGTWDGVASLLIGLLLVWVAWVLGRSNAELLTGRPLPPAERAAIRSELLATDHVDAVLDLVTLVQGPDEALVAAKIDFRDASTAAQIEWACERAERRIRDRFPRVTRVYLDPTPGMGQRRREGLSPWGDGGQP
ncbi:cation transporter, partial [Streptomyces sp. SID11233]|nr:cation transporter [Streptomyces sp. SID11233]